MINKAKALGMTKKETEIPNVFKESTSSLRFILPNSAAKAAPFAPP